MIAEFSLLSFLVCFYHVSLSTPFTISPIHLYLLPQILFQILRTPTRYSRAWADVKLFSSISHSDGEGRLVSSWRFTPSQWVRSPQADGEVHIARVSARKRPMGRGGGGGGGAEVPSYQSDLHRADGAGNCFRRGVSMQNRLFVCLLSVPETCKCISDLLRQFYVLPH